MLNVQEGREKEKLLYYILVRIRTIGVENWVNL